MKKKCKTPNKQNFCVQFWIKNMTVQFVQVFIKLNVNARLPSASSIKRQTNEKKINLFY